MKIKKQKGIAMVVFLMVLLILFILFGALTYRVQTSLFLVRNSYLEVQAEATANAAARHAIRVISNIPVNNTDNSIFPLNIEPPTNFSASEPFAVPSDTYDLAYYDPNSNNPSQSIQSVQISSFTQLREVPLGNGFSYRICVWQYTPPDSNQPDTIDQAGIIRVKIFVTYKGKLIKSYIFTVAS